MNITITINTDNDAFHENTAGEVARILQQLTYDVDHNRFTVRCGEHERLRDVNGNTVGRIEVSA